MTRSTVLGAVALVLTFAATSATTADSKDERAGNCNDAKQQMEYFCDESKSANDTMVAIGTACTNAKNNVKAACEGVAEPDKAYKFDK
jgi:hypothetical protein